jgi:hypothetical protein
VKLKKRKRGGIRRNPRRNLMKYSPLLLHKIMARHLNTSQMISQMITPVTMKMDLEKRPLILNLRKNFSFFQ